MPEPNQMLMLYDGVCGLCNRGVQFFLRRDRHDRIRFAPLQSKFAEGLLARHGIDHLDLDTVYAVLNPGGPDEVLLTRSDAVIALTRPLGGVWKAAVAGKVIPRPLRNFFYDLVARNRYRVFGKYDSCMLPSPETRHKFVDG
jgi:predicted DCC family thiol-disulfide oxidoreductase YuxK